MTKLTKLLKGWLRRFEWFTYFNHGDGHFLMVDFFTTDVTPLYHYESYDTDRWTCLNIWVEFRCRRLSITLPYKKLPDFVPTSERQIAARKRHKEHIAKLEQEKNNGNNQST